MARTFTVSFKINGAMDGSLQAALQAAANAMRGLGNAARQASAAAQASKAGLAGMAAGLNQLQQAAQRFKQVQDALKQTTADWSKAQQAVTSAKAKYEADTAAVEKLKAKLDELKAAQSKLGTSKSAGNATLKQLRQDLQRLKQAYADAKKAGDAMKMSQLGTQIKSTQGAIQAQQAAVRQAAEAYRKLSEQVKQAKAELQAAQAAQSTSSRGLSSAQSDASKLAASYQRQQAALRSLVASLSSAGFNVSSFASAESRLAGDIDRVNAALRQQQALMNAQSRSAQASQEMFNAYNNFQGALQTAQQVAAPFEAAAENAMNFEHAMSKVKSLTQMRDIRAGNLDKVNASMQALTDTATTLGATTEFTSKEVADAMGKLGMAGWDDKKINAAMSSIVDLATIADRHDIQRTADVVSDDMTALGIKAGESMTLASGKVVDGVKYFSDAFAYATTQANLDQELLHEALKYNAPTGKASGLSLGEIFAMNMVSANAGIKGSMAGTSFRAGWVRMLAPPKTAQKAFEQMGMTASDATKQIMEAQEALTTAGISESDDLFTKIQKVQQHYQSLDKNARAGWLKNVVGQNALSGWQIALEKGNFADIMKFAQEIDSGAIEGWASDTATVMRDDTKTSVELLKSSLDALQKSVGDALTPAIRAAAEAFAPLVTAAGEFIAQNPAIVQGAAAIAAALTTVVVGAAAVKLAFAGWTFITSTVALVQTALASLGSGAMLGGVIARVTALRTALFGLGGAATLGGWSAMFASISTTAATAATSIRAFFASLTLGSMASGIVSTLSAIGTAIRGAAMAAMSFAFSPVGVALMALGLAGMYVYQNWDRVAPVFSNIAGIITGALSPAITQIQAAFSALSSSGAFSSLASAASQLASVVGGTLVKAFAVLATVVASALAVAIRAIADFVTFASEALTGVMDIFGKLSEGDFSGAWEAWQSHGSKAIENIKNLGSHVFDGVEQGAKNVQQTLDALNAPKMPTQAAVARHAVHFDESGVARSPAPEAQPIDTSATQAALDQVGNSAQNAATNMDGVNQATQQISQAGADVQQFGAGMQTASTGVQQFGTTAQTTSANVQELGANSQAAGGGITSLADAASGATGGVSALGSAASGAAGSVSGLGAAVQSACSQLAAAGANAAAAVASAAPKANYKGGIYKKGAFLTTFAEKSPEAAIPLDNSQRAIDLWTQTGQILGQLPGKGGVNYEQGRKFEDAIKDYNKNPGDFGTLNKTLDTHAQIFGGGRYGGQSRRRAMPTLPQELPQPKGEMSDDVRKRLENLDRLIKAADYLPDAAKAQQTKAELIQMREYLLRKNGLSVEQTRSTSRRSAYMPRPNTMPRSHRHAINSTSGAMSSRNSFPLITTPGFNPDVPLPTSTTATRQQNNSFSELTGWLSGKIESVLPTGTGGLIGGLLENILPQSQQSSSGAPTFTINVTVNGNANADEVQRGVEQAIPSLEEFSRRYDMLMHENARRSFA